MVTVLDKAQGEVTRLEDELRTLDRAILDAQAQMLRATAGNTVEDAMRVEAFKRLRAKREEERAACAQRLTQARHRLEEVLREGYFMAQDVAQLEAATIGWRRIGEAIAAAKVLQAVFAESSDLPPGWDDNTARGIVAWLNQKQTMLASLPARKERLAEHGHDRDYNPVSIAETMDRRFWASGLNRADSV